MEQRKTPFDTSINNNIPSFTFGTEIKPQGVSSQFGILYRSLKIMNNRFSIRKTGGALSLKKSSSMEVPARKSLYAVEFPTSPNPTNSPGEEKLHPSHSQHPLLQLDVPELFTCSGCKEHGAGKRFSCQQCDFQLHDFCALSPPALKSHPLHAQHQLTFYSKPKPGLYLSLISLCCF